MGALSRHGGLTASNEGVTFHHDIPAPAAGALDRRRPAIHRRKCRSSSARTAGVEQIVEVARHGRHVVLALGRRARHGRMTAGAASIDALADDVRAALRDLHRVRRPGHHAHPAAPRAALQTSLIRSHAAGSGAPVENARWSAALMLLRLVHPGHAVVPASGRPPRPAWPACSNAGITPIVPEYGSLGCSGDLAPLATVALALIGEGRRHRLVRPAQGMRDRRSQRPG